MCVAFLSISGRYDVFYFTHRERQYNVKSVAVLTKRLKLGNCFSFKQDLKLFLKPEVEAKNWFQDERCFCQFLDPV